MADAMREGFVHFASGEIKVPVDYSYLHGTDSEGTRHGFEGSGCLVKPGFQHEKAIAIVSAMEIQTGSGV